MPKTLSLHFHHIGKPVPLIEIKENPDTKYAEVYDMYSLDQSNSLSIPIELHAFGPKCPLHPLIQTETHIAFTTDDIQQALENQEILMPLYQPFAGYQCAMILVNGQLIELIETTLSEREIWGDGIFKDSLLYPENKK